ncbi:glycosyltransferase family 2 protein [Pseudosulfitobacter pseudonitzschiae]|uniref:glycosyltransferase family 2 protein n=1 Tax=Pseudosulfitobacter pseudonitzschiae TaxID=1402135 RepID=UPI001AF7B087|nr:glycosyltransferase family 2 protein [Pseudosulfitobacter pseudonitzschiae]MBM1817355.1 glycosyltransferase [Pseudosulfitobacter pseudonitzschiae]MBM1834553.1 glycosyltransferase [Pseudosulfitobacter pseudonitzschiae]MBM1839418.1 glycosyltransferase [Pseudosulfitobacter pseudonitzschiae]MBM1844268.1 glycosyltransferase [Pseudosulfitobacter pseudonitzschiae]MBM1849103.1 glycosyltransferase [Pseudosulfitobacter pseudonitzschiae]
MKISIVTAVYNRASTIAQAITSVQSQSYDNVEHILQDGGSSDGSLEIINKLSNPYTHVVSAPDRGIYDAINKGISRATGEVVGLMHSDDYFASDAVLAKVAAAFQQSDIDGVYGDLDYVSASDTSRIIRCWKSGDLTPAKLRRGWMPPHPTLYLRRSVFELFGKYDTSYTISADYDAMLRWLWIHQIKLSYIPEVMVKMRVGGESNRSLDHILRKSREDYRALRKNGVGGAWALGLKNARKISQFIVKS